MCKWRCCKRNASECNDRSLSDTAYWPARRLDVDVDPERGNDEGYGHDGDAAEHVVETGEMGVSLMWCLMKITLKTATYPDV